MFYPTARGQGDRALAHVAGAFLVISLTAGCGGSGNRPQAEDNRKPPEAAPEARRPPAPAGPRAEDLQSARNLQQIAFALHAHHDTHFVLPGLPPEGKPLLSWRVAILPFLGEQALCSQFKLDEPWDSPHNAKLLDKMPAVYLNPRFQQKDDKPYGTYYQGFSGTGGVLGAPGGLSLGAITCANGASNTFLVVEAGAPIPWTQPEDLVHDLDEPIPPLGGPRGGDFLAAFCDGHLRRIPAPTEEKLLRSMIRYNNTTGFALPGQWLRVAK